MVRLERLLANRGYCNRSEAKGFLRIHQVLVKGVRVEKPDTRVGESDVTINGEPIDPETLLLLVNKPVGVVCSHKEDAGSGGPSGPLVYELLPERWRRRDPQISSVGRLDKDTSGVLLLTDDGALLHRLTSPKHHVPRVYLATLDRDLRGNEGELFASGKMMLEREEKPLLPAKLEVLGPRSARLTLGEGRYHQVRRMFAATGNHVVALHRELFGTLGVEGVETGKCRSLTPAEEAALRGV